MPRLKLTIAYVGTGFHGWQTQARKDKVVPTIQGIVEAQIARISGCPVHLHGAGRTDAGCTPKPRWPMWTCPRRKGTLTGRWRSTPACRRASALSRPFALPTTSTRSTTPYAKRTTTACGSPGATRRQAAPLCLGVRPLDVSRMDEAARFLVGTHDFASLRNAGTDVLSTVRTMLSITRRPSGPSLPKRHAAGPC